MVVLVGQEVQAFASDHNLIRKDIVDNLLLRPLFTARAVTQGDSIHLKPYWVLYERLQITDSFGEYLDDRDPLTLANIKVPLVLGLSWLQHHNPILNFNPMTIQWRDSSSTVTESIEKVLDFESITQIPTNARAA